MRTYMRWPSASTFTAIMVTLILVLQVLEMTR